MKRSLVTILILSLMAVNAITQTPTGRTPAETAASAPAGGFDSREFELQMEAGRKAKRISDPELRIKAYEKMLADFPKNPPVSTVNRGILDTHIEFWPSQTDRILALIDKVIDPGRESKKTGFSNNPHNQIANQLMDAGILIDKAEKLALTGLALF